MPVATLSRPRRSDGERVAEVVRRVARGLVPEEMTLRDFTLRAWKIIEPATPLTLNWHHELILEYLELAFKKEITRIVFNVPPRTLKSILTSVIFPDWAWTKAPWSRWVFTSYSQSLSTDFSVKRRRILKDDWFQEKWGNQVVLANDQDLKTEFENTQTGKMISSSTGGTITGKGGEYIVMDDPQNPKMAESEAERKQANEFYTNTLISRLNDKKRDVMILVQQRLHAEDTTALVLKEGGWTHVDVQAMAEKRRAYSFPITKKRHVVQEGQLLQEDREGKSEYDATRKAMGSRTHDAQYQQRPTSETGNIWKRYFWNYYKELPREKFDAVIQSWDLAFKDTTGSSYVAGQVWGLLGSKKYLLDQVREKLDYPATKRAMLSMIAKWPSSKAILIEDKANGPAIISDMGRTVPGLIPVTPMGDKIVRAVAVTPTIEAGDCYLPSPEIAPWVNEFLKETAAFPESPYKDQVDAASQALSRMDELGGVLAEAKELATQEQADPIDAELGDGIQESTEVFSHD